MKIFKWYVVSEYDEFLDRRVGAKVYKKRIEFLEKINYEQYKKIEKLEKENQWLKNHQRIEIVNLEEE